MQQNIVDFGLFTGSVDNEKKFEHQPCFVKGLELAITLAPPGGFVKSDPVIDNACEHRSDQGRVTFMG